MTARIVHVMDYDADGRMGTYAITLPEDGLSVFFEPVSDT